MSSNFGMAFELKLKCIQYFTLIPILKIHVALPVFMKCGAGQHKLKVYATNGRYIIRNGINGILWYFSRSCSGESCDALPHVNEWAS